MAEVTQVGQHLGVPNISIQPASGDEHSSSSESEDNNVSPPHVRKEDAEGDSGDTTDDTSAWDSDPAMVTPRSSREYYPLKGSSEKIYPSNKGDASFDNPSANKPSHSVNEYLKTLSGHLGDGDSNLTGDGNLAGIPISAYRRVVDGREEGKDGADGDSEEDEELKYLQEDGDDEEEDDIEEEDGDEDIEELDLTKHKPTIHQDNVARGAHIMYMPSFDALGANSISALMSQLIGNQPSLFTSQDSSTEEEDEEKPGNGVTYLKRLSTDEGDDAQLHKWEELFHMLEIQHQQQLMLQSEQHERRMEHLRLLMSQQQNELQELHNTSSNKDMDQKPITPPNQPILPTEEPATLPNQDTHHYKPSDDDRAEIHQYVPVPINENTNKQSTIPSNGYANQEFAANTRHYIPGSDDSEVTSPRDEIPADQQHHVGENLKERNLDLDDSDLIGNNNVQFTDANDVAVNEQSSHDKGLTTWSDVKGQRSDVKGQRSYRSMEERTLPVDEVPKDSMTDERKGQDEMVSRGSMEELKQHYKKETESMQKQYEEQLQAVQQEWYQLQQQQQDQQQILHQLLAKQQERIEYQQRALDRQKDDDDEDRTPTGTPDHLRECSDSDISSNTYNNFSYWRLREQDTYRSLPLSPSVASTEQKPSVEDKMAPSQRLKEKHARHVADLKTYYESEIQDLRTQLTEVSNLHDYSPSKTLKRTNERLQQNCSKLDAALSFANGRIQDLEKTVAALGARLTKEPERSMNSSMSSLHQMTEDLKILCHQRQIEKEELDRKNNKLQLALEQAYKVQDVHAKEDKRDQRMLNRVMAEYKTLAQDHELAKAQLGATEMQLYDAKAESAQLKRNVGRLEVELKRLSHERDRASHTSISAGSGSILSDHQGSSYLHYTSPPQPEERRFLQPTAGYNVFSGEDNDTSSESLLQASDTESSQDRCKKVSKSKDNRPPNLTLEQAPFDSDLEDRPLSPMMKAAAQFNRWRREGDEDRELNAVLQDPPPRMDNDSTDSDEDGNMTLQNVSTQTLNGAISNHGQCTLTSLHQKSSYRQSSSSNQETSGHKYRSRQHTTSDVLSQSDHQRDSSIHIWPESEPRNRHKSPSYSAPERRPATSPRQQARQSLARYQKDQSSSPISKRKTSRSPSPRRNLASQFQEAAEQQRGSPMGSSDRMESPKRVHGQMGNSNTFSTRKSLLEGQEGLSSGSPNRGVSRMPAEKENAVQNTLARVRSGEILTTPDRKNNVAQQGFSPRNPKKPEEIGHKIMQKLGEHEKRLDELMMEKRKLESALSHIPTSGRGIRQQQEKLEDELDRVSRELGSVRMLLRKYNALKTSSSSS